MHGQASAGALVSGGTDGSSTSAVTASAFWEAPDARRWLQLGLATIWLLDAVLQFQSFMFTRAFGSDMLGSMAANNPWIVARPIALAAQEIGNHPELSNATFAVVQLVIALGIASRRTVKAALVASVVWSLGVWWFGEGLGGVLTGSASPLSGAPGAVVLYALLAVLLWPVKDGGGEASFVAARPLGPVVARSTWFVLWMSLAYFVLQPAERSPNAIQSALAAQASGEPGWLASLDRDAAKAMAGHGLLGAIAFACVLGIVAVGIFFPRGLLPYVLGLAVAVAAVIWVFGENFGALFTGSATDPNSGPLLVLLATAFWPLRPRLLEQEAAAPDRVVTGVVDDPTKLAAVGG